MSMHRFSLTLVPALLTVPLLACGGGGGGTGDSDPTLTGITDSQSSLTAETSDTNDSSSQTTTATTTAGDGDGAPGDGDGTPGDGDGTPDPTTTGSMTSGPRFDLVPVPDSPMYDTSCGEIDFLFVIDNSGSMSDEQAALVNSFPAFIDGIQLALESVDSIHVGVTTTDDYYYNNVGCTTIGGLVGKTGGTYSSNSVCTPYADGFNYLMEDDDLHAKFACAAQVGIDGSADERPMYAAIQAVNSTYANQGQCNFQFIREDALLVIIIITDEPDANSLGGSVDWFNQIVAVKDGIPENIVVVSIINTPNGVCGSPAQTIADFTNMFGINGYMADICLLDFNTIFNQAISVIDVACDNYVQN